MKRWQDKTSDPKISKPKVRQHKPKIRSPTYQKSQKYQDINGHTNWIVNSVLNWKSQEASNYLSFLMFDNVGADRKSTTSQNFHIKLSSTGEQPRKSKRWVYTGDTPQFFWHSESKFFFTSHNFRPCETKFWFNSHNFRHCETKLWSPSKKFIFKIFRTLENFNFQIVEFLQSWS